MRRVRVSCLVQRTMATPTLLTLVLFAPPDLLLSSAVRSVPPVSLGPSAPQPADHPAPPVLLEATAASANQSALPVSLARIGPLLNLASARLAHLAGTAPTPVQRKKTCATRASTARLDPLLKPRAPEAASAPRAPQLHPLAPKALMEIRSNLYQSRNAPAAPPVKTPALGPWSAPHPAFRAPGTCTPSSATPRKARSSWC